MSLINRNVTLKSILHGLLYSIVFIIAVVCIIVLADNLTREKNANWKIGLIVI